MKIIFFYNLATQEMTTIAQTINRLESTKKMDFSENPITSKTVLTLTYRSNYYPNLVKIHSS